jgi:hypothetical protein
MTFNSENIVQEIRTEFEMLLDFVTGAEAQTTTADRIERGLFRHLLDLGAKLLLLFFVVRAQNCSREPLQKQEGQELPYHDERKRTYFSIFGKIPFWRPYFYQSGGGEAPLDAELSLGSDRYSDFLREMSEYLAVYVAYGKDADLLKRFFDLPLSTRVLQQVIDADATDVEPFYTQKPPPCPAEEADILVIQADGKGVPMVLETPAEPIARRKKSSPVSSTRTRVLALRVLAPKKRPPNTPNPRTSMFGPLWMAKMPLWTDWRSKLHCDRVATSSIRSLCATAVKRYNRASKLDSPTSNSSWTSSIPMSTCGMWATACWARPTSSEPSGSPRKHCRCSQAKPNTSSLNSTISPKRPTTPPRNAKHSPKQPITSSVTCPIWTTRLIWRRAGPLPLA